MLEIITAG